MMEGAIIINWTMSNVDDWQLQMYIIITLSFCILKV